MAFSKIGTISDKVGIKTGRAFKRGDATSDFNDNYFDLGFSAETIFIENVSGTGMLVVSFQDSSVTGVAPTTIHSEIDPMSSRIYRKRREQVLAVKYMNAPCTFRIEAW